MDHGGSVVSEGAVPDLSATLEDMRSSLSAVQHTVERMCCERRSAEWLLKTGMPSTENMVMAGQWLLISAPGEDVDGESASMVRSACRSVSAWLHDLTKALERDL